MYPRSSLRILIIGGSGSEKINALLNLINNQPDIDKIYLYAKDPYEAKYQYLVNKREKIGLDNFKDRRAFIEYSNDMQDVYKNIEDYNPGKKRKMLIVFDDMIADMKRELHQITLNHSSDVDFKNALHNHIHF